MWPQMPMSFGDFAMAQLRENNVERPRAVKWAPNFKHDLPRPCNPPTNQIPLEYMHEAEKSEQEIQLLEKFSLAIKQRLEQKRAEKYHMARLQQNSLAQIAPSEWQTDPNFNHQQNLHIQRGTEFPQQNHRSSVNFGRPDVSEWAEKDFGRLNPLIRFGKSESQNTNLTPGTFGLNRISEGSELENPEQNRRYIQPNFDGYQQVSNDREMKFPNLALQNQRNKSHNEGMQSWHEALKSSRFLSRETQNADLNGKEVRMRNVVISGEEFQRSPANNIVRPVGKRPKFKVSPIRNPETNRGNDLSNRVYQQPHRIQAFRNNRVHQDRILPDVHEGENLGNGGNNGSEIGQNDDRNRRAENKDFQPQTIQAPQRAIIIPTEQLQYRIPQTGTEEILPPSRTRNSEGSDRVRSSIQTSKNPLLLSPKPQRVKEISQNTPEKSKNPLIWGHNCSKTLMQKSPTISPSANASEIQDKNDESSRKGRRANKLSWASQRIRSPRKEEQSPANIAQNSESAQIQSKDLSWVSKGFRSSRRNDFFPANGVSQNEDVQNVNQEIEDIQRLQIQATNSEIAQNEGGSKERLSEFLDITKSCVPAASENIIESDLNSPCAFHSQEGVPDQDQASPLLHEKPALVLSHDSANLLSIGNEIEKSPQNFGPNTEQTPILGNSDVQEPLFLADYQKQKGDFGPEKERSGNISPLAEAPRRPPNSGMPKEPEFPNLLQNVEIPEVAGTKNSKDNKNQTGNEGQGNQFAELSSSELEGIIDRLGNCDAALKDQIESEELLPEILEKSNISSGESKESNPNKLRRSEEDSGNINGQNKELSGIEAANRTITPEEAQEPEYPDPNRNAEISETSCAKTSKRNEDQESNRSQSNQILQISSAELPQDINAWEHCNLALKDQSESRGKISETLENSKTTSVIREEPDSIEVRISEENSENNRVKETIVGYEHNGQMREPSGIGQTLQALKDVGRAISMDSKILAYSTIVLETPSEIQILPHSNSKPLLEPSNKTQEASGDTILQDHQEILQTCQNIEHQLQENSDFEVETENLEVESLSEAKNPEVILKKIPEAISDEISARENEAEFSMANILTLFENLGENGLGSKDQNLAIVPENESITSYSQISKGMGANSSEKKEQTQKSGNSDKTQRPAEIVRFIQKNQQGKTTSMPQESPTKSDQVQKFLNSQNEVGKKELGLQGKSVLGKKKGTETAYEEWDNLIDILKQRKAQKTKCSSSNSLEKITQLPVTIGRIKNLPSQQHSPSKKKRKITMASLFKKTELNFGFDDRIDTANLKSSNSARYTQFEKESPPSKKRKRTIMSYSPQNFGQEYLQEKDKALTEEENDQGRKKTRFTSKSPVQKEKRQNPRNGEIEAEKRTRAERKRKNSELCKPENSVELDTGRFLEDFASQGNLLCLHNLRHARPSSAPQDNLTKKVQTSHISEKVCSRCETNYSSKWHIDSELEGIICHKCSLQSIPLERTSKRSGPIPQRKKNTEGPTKKQKFLPHIASSPGANLNEKDGIEKLAKKSQKLNKVRHLAEKKQALRIGVQPPKAKSKRTGLVKKLKEKFKGNFEKMNLKGKLGNFIREPGTKSKGRNSSEAKHKFGNRELARLALGGLAQCTNDPESDGTLALVQELSLNFRYPKRIPGGDHMEHPPFRRFLDLIRDNSEDFQSKGRILRCKQYMKPDANPAMIDEVISALSVNTRIEVLYIQNYERGMLDDQLKRLTDEVLKKGRIWALNIGENFNVSLEAWQEFATALEHTSVGFMYVSEHHLIRTDLKSQMKDAIRKNRRKLELKDRAMNDLIKNMWFNPTAEVARRLEVSLRKQQAE